MISHATTWTNASDLANTRMATKADIDRASKLLSPGSQASYMFEDPSDWRVAEGKIQVKDNLMMDTMLIVFGDLMIAGSYDDGHGDGHAVVLGNMQVEHLTAWGFLHVKGTLNASGLVFGYYNDYSFEVPGKLNAKGVVSYDKGFDAELGKVGLYLNSHDASEEARHVLLLEPELLTDPESLELDEDSTASGLYPDFDLVRTRIRDGLPIFRAKPAPVSLLTDVKVALDASSSAKALSALIGKDRLLPQLIAARADLPKALHQPLWALNDPIVRSWVARVNPNLATGKGVVLTPKIAEGLVENPGTSEAQLQQILQSNNPEIRKALFARERLPQRFFELLANDADASIRARAVHDWLPEAMHAKLVTDQNEEVRMAIARVPVNVALSKKLAADTASVREALANSLAEQHLQASITKMSEAERISVVELLLTADIANKDAATGAFLALPATQQNARFDALLSAKRLYVDQIARQTISHAVMDKIVAIADQVRQPIPKSLAENLALPDRLQRLILQRAMAYQPKRAAGDDIDFDDTPHTALEALLYRDDALPEVLEGSVDLAVQMGINPSDGGMQNALFHNRQLTPKAIAKLDQSLANSSDWALTLMLQRHADRSQLLRAIENWHNDETELLSELRSFSKLSDAQFWSALANAKHQELLEVASFNSHASTSDLQTLLGKHPDAISSIATHPNAPKAAILAAAQKGDQAALQSPAIDLATLKEFVWRHPDFYARSPAAETLSARWRKLQSVGN